MERYSIKQVHEANRQCDNKDSELSTGRTRVELTSLANAVVLPGEGYPSNSGVCVMPDGIRRARACVYIYIATVPEYVFH